MADPTFLAVSALPKLEFVWVCGCVLCVLCVLCVHVRVYLMKGCKSILVDQIWADTTVEQLPH